MKQMKSVIARILVATLVLGSIPIAQTESEAASKVKLSTKKLTITKGKTKNLSVKNARMKNMSF